MGYSGGGEVHEILRADAGDGELVRRGDGAGGGGPLHGAGEAGNVAAFQEHEGGDSEGGEGELRGAGGEGRERGDHERRYAEAEDAGAEVQAAESSSAYGNHGP